MIVCELRVFVCVCVRVVAAAALDGISVLGKISINQLKEEDCSHYALFYVPIRLHHFCHQQHTQHIIHW